MRRSWTRVKLQNCATTYESDPSFPFSSSVFFETSTGTTERTIFMKSYQTSFNENWTWRSPNDVEITPKVPLPRAVPGFKK